MTHNIDADNEKKINVNQYVFLAIVTSQSTRIDTVVMTTSAAAIKNNEKFYSPKLCANAPTPNR